MGVIPKPNSPFWLRHWRAVLLLMILIGMAVLYRTTNLKEYASVPGILHLREHILEAGWHGAVIFLAIYVVVLSVGLPNLPLQLAAGAVYGLWPAFLMMYIGVNLGAAGAFWLARKLGRAAIEELWGHHLKKLNERVERGGFRYLLVLRLIPLMPFNATNYASGISRIHFQTFFLATALGTPVLTFVHIAIGAAAGHIDTRPGRTWTHPDVYIPLLIAAVAVFMLVGLRPLAAFIKRHWRGAPKIPELDETDES